MANGYLSIYSAVLLKERKVRPKKRNAYLVKIAPKPEPEPKKDSPAVEVEFVTLPANNPAAKAKQSKLYCLRLRLYLAFSDRLLCTIFTR